MIGLISWLVTGFVVGLAARFLLPGPASWVASMSAALLGALAGGAVATLLAMGGLAEFDTRGLLLAFLAATLAVILTQLLRTLMSRND